VIKRASVADRTDESTGIVFDSKGELRRWHELQLLMRVGEISELRRQVKFLLCVNGKPIFVRSEGFPNGRKVKFTADFVYRENGREVVEDFKSYQTDIARLRIALVEACCGVIVKITGSARIRKNKSGRSTGRPA
jgi:hypothetical protein